MGAGLSSFSIFSYLKVNGSRIAERIYKLDEIAAE